MKVFSILLAAGAGSRFLGPSHKLTALLRGRPVVSWALSSALESLRPVAPISRLIVVTGAVAVELPDLGDLGELVEVIHNPRWAEGQATSLRAGLAAAQRADADAVVVGLGDQPFVTADAWTSVARSTSLIAVATYDGVRGNPVRLHRSVWPMLPDRGDAGARSLMALRPDLVHEVACSGSAADIDTLEDLHTWNSSTNSP